MRLHGTGWHGSIACLMSLRSFQHRVEECALSFSTLLLVGFPRKPINS